MAFDVFKMIKKISGYLKPKGCFEKVKILKGFASNKNDYN